MKIAFISTRGIPNNYGASSSLQNIFPWDWSDGGMKLWYTLRISIPYREPDYKGGTHKAYL